MNLEIALTHHILLCWLFFFLEFSLSADCKSLLSRIPLTKVKHVYREAKKCADALARKGCTLWEDFVIFDVPPSFVISSFVCSNVNGVNYRKLSHFGFLV